LLPFSDGPPQRERGPQRELIEGALLYTETGSCKRKNRVPAKNVNGRGSYPPDSFRLDEGPRKGRTYGKLR